MKSTSCIFWGIALLAGLSFISPAACVLEEQILNLLEEIRMRMCHPIPKFGLPALDPFTIDHLEAEMNTKYVVDFKGSITNFALTGLSDFEVNDLKISSVPLRRSTIDVTLPLTAFKSLYTAKGSLAYILNLAGDGVAQASVTKVRVSISWMLKAGLTLGVRSLKITLQIGEIYVDFENLLEEQRVNEFVHALINELGIELLDDLWQDENEMVEQLVEDKINSVLGQYTLQDIINIIAGGGGGEGGPIFGPNDPPPDCKDTNKV